MLDDKRIPVTILTGYLGSGKTTIINNIIKNTSKRIGIIVNEIGEIDIDGQILEQNTDEIIKFSDKCMCCAVRGDIINSVNQLIELHKPDYILIETSGLAHPLPIAMSLMEDRISEKVKIDAIICVIDTINIFPQLKNDNMIEEQLDSSDLVLLNKINLASAEKLEIVCKYLQETKPNSPIIEVINNTIDEDILFSTNLYNSDLNYNTSNHNHSTFDTKSYIFTGEFNLEKFKLFINSLSNNIYRAKGYIKLNNKYYSFNKVGEKIDLEGDIDYKFNENRLVFIGKNLDGLDELFKSFIL